MASSESVTDTANSRKLSAQRTLNSLLLTDGGITDVALNRLHVSNLYDTTTHQRINPKHNDMAQR